MKAVILVNVGTPESPSPKDVGIYLNEFLMDENILPIPRPLRDILVKLLIVPRRKYQSAEKYKTIWTDQGSPLMVEMIRLQAALQASLGPDFQTVLGMQIGFPRLREALKTASTSDQVIVLPLYPQYAKATNGGAEQAIKESGLSARIRALEPFYYKPWYVQAVAARIRAELKPQDHLLLSFHGLPVSQAGEYPKQCQQTAELVRQALGLNEVSVSFQSRLGRTRWVEPYTQDKMKELVKSGVKHLKVACPAFVVDCLETLEEIGQELREEFLSHGGETFALIPCVNDHPIFVAGLAEEVRKLSL